ncbi:putative palmitoyltransferase ZDHHC4 [Tupaia chinensis]|uniref:Palmitoyltransferase n=1 Tax=Tupaia chinensis TaxID=246437 RepID=L9L4E8_TUPCH|nr:putative palmitoyltransferase ZDHHC4 [Tupaia chinensis]
MKTQYMSPLNATAPAAWVPKLGSRSAGREGGTTAQVGSVCFTAPTFIFARGCEGQQRPKVHFLAITSNHNLEPARTLRKGSFKYHDALLTLPPEVSLAPGAALTSGVRRKSPAGPGGAGTVRLAVGRAWRNHTFIILHLVVQGMVYTEYTWEIFGYCQELEFSLYYLILPYLLLAINLSFFTLTCVANPGTITKANELLFLQIYEFDEMMFPKNVKCPTCDLRKPARSKHCSVCNWCVHRFDHHCVWVNNCIGAWNTRYFLIYLFTLTASAATMAIVSTAFLVHLAVVSDLYQEIYIDDFGRFQVMDTVFLIQDQPGPIHCFSTGVCNWCVHRFDHHCVWVNNCIGAWNTRYFLIYLFTLTASAATMAIVSTAFLVHLAVVSDLYQEIYIDDFGRFQVMDTVFLIQYLFLTFPRIVFMLGFVLVLSFLLGGYMCFALYLAATNQTTNEWYKGDWAWCQHCPLVAQSPSAEPQVYKNIHSHGLWSNLREIFIPAFPHYERKKK